MNVCFAAIYRWITKERKNKNPLFLFLRQQGRRPRRKTLRQTTRFRGGRPIIMRPPEAEGRFIPGHWEADTVEGRKGGKRLVTLVCRATRVAKLMLVPDGKAKTVSRAIIQCLGRNPDLVHTITFDNGSEFADFHEVEEILGVTAYFADPYSPWQRGTNENTNGLIRQYLPKGVSMDRLSGEYIQAIEDSLNRRPRKVLNWQTPLESLQSKMSGASQMRIRHSRVVISGLFLARFASFARQPGRS